MDKVLTAEHEKLSLKCSFCDKVFANAPNRRRHEVKIHKVKTVRSNYDLKCSECEISFPSSKDCVDHIQQSHPDIILKNECLSFETESEFETWKLDFCKKTESEYILKKALKTLQGQVKVFVCHRRGSFTSRSTGKRNIKIGGSNKTGFYCPAEMKAKILDSGKVNVIMQTTHVGHQCQVEKLRLSKPEKDNLARQIMAGIPFQCILRNISATAEPSSRLASTSLQDLRNIVVAYGINTALIENKIPNENQASDSEGLIINTLQDEALQAEKEILKNESKKTVHPKLRQIVVAMWTEFGFQMKTYTSNKTFQEIALTMRALKQRCEALEANAATSLSDS